MSTGYDDFEQSVEKDNGDVLAVGESISVVTIQNRIYFENGDLHSCYKHLSTAWIVVRTKFDPFSNTWWQIDVRLVQDKNKKKVNRS